MNKSPVSRIPLFKIKVAEKGKIKDIKDAVARCDGLPNCLYGQIVNMGEDIPGIIMGYNESAVLILVLGDEGKLRLGAEVTGISEPFRIPVGRGFLGRMVTALGEPCDAHEPIVPDDHFEVFRDSPPITARSPVDQFMEMGTKIVDIMAPIAKGQRQLILGDRMTGKTVVALDAIIHQRDRDVVCIYCSIGQSQSNLKKNATILHEAGAFDYTVLMVASDSAPPGEQYLVPFCAATMGDYFASQGQDVLLILDDLTKHAWAYRQLSLLLDRPPGREAYPGDIFYVQTQLMERAGRFNDEHGGASMTFIGIAETLQGDLTGYIPSNLSSMCDGQICMDSSLFAEGFRPAVDVGLSLSIIGGRVQPPILKQLSSGLRADIARYRELSTLSRLQTGLAGEALAMMKRGQAIRILLQQRPFQPSSLAEGTALLYALSKNLLADLDEEDIRAFRDGIRGFAERESPALIEEINRLQEMTPDIEAGLDKLISNFFKVKPQKTHSDAAEESGGGQA